MKPEESARLFLMVPLELYHEGAQNPILFNKAAAFHHEA